MIITRRGFITGLTALITAPAIVRAQSIMPVKMYPSLGCIYQSPALELFGLSDVYGNDGTGEIFDEMTSDIVERIMNAQMVCVR